MPITALHGNRTKYDLTKPALGLTFYENFLGAGLLWTSDLLQRDYALLDEIHPGRVKSVEEWMDKTGYDGSKKQVMKSQQ
ncbi:hypothetical protein HK405_011306 [Cladochytrium tenue]|nr:hypothetical protein HK405_011306 [Cladochytrium tenue]